MAGLLLGANINKETYFERKNFFFPDLPKGYQLCQYSRPICSGGKVNLSSGKTININRIHLEENAGRLIHDIEKDCTFIDFNRSGVPILEIVTEPDFSNAVEVLEFITRLKRILMFSGLSDCRMENGSLKFDINISLKEAGSNEIGTRIEMKNLASFRDVVSAIDFEIGRQMDVLENREEVDMETRVWDALSEKTLSDRIKESVSDYRHHPDPDLKKIIITDEDILAIKETIPETYESRLSRYEKLNLTERDIDIILSEKCVSDLFDDTLKIVDNPKEVINWISNEVLRVYNEQNKTSFESIITAENLASIIKMIDNDQISRFNARIVFDEVVKTGKSALVLVKDLELWGDISHEDLKFVIESIISENPNIMYDYNRDKNHVINYIIGGVKTLTNGKARPEEVTQIVLEILG